MLKIGDFSQRGQASIRTLRLYDEMDLLNPAQIKSIVIEVQIPIVPLDAPR